MGTSVSVEYMSSGWKPFIAIFCRFRCPEAKKENPLIASCELVWCLSFKCLCTSLVEIRLNRACVAILKYRVINHVFVFDRAVGCLNFEL